MQSMRAERERQESRSTLKPISVNPAPRSIPTPRPAPRPRSAPLRRFSATPAHRSVPIHPIFGSLRANTKVWITQN